MMTEGTPHLGGSSARYSYTGQTGCGKQDEHRAPLPIATRTVELPG
jgi:hypothetical protein